MEEALNQLNDKWTVFVTLLQVY